MNAPKARRKTGLFLFVLVVHVYLPFCARGKNKKSNEEMVPAVGIELTTYRLQGGCSTN